MGCHHSKTGTVDQPKRPVNGVVPSAVQTSPYANAAELGVSKPKNFVPTAVVSPSAPGLTPAGQSSYSQAHRIAPSPGMMASPIASPMNLSPSPIASPMASHVNLSPSDKNYFGYAGASPRSPFMAANASPVIFSASPAHVAASTPAVTYSPSPRHGIVSSPHHSSPAERSHAMSSPNHLSPVRVAQSSPAYQPINGGVYMSSPASSAKPHHSEPLSEQNFHTQLLNASPANQNQFSQSVFDQRDIRVYSHAIAQNDSCQQPCCRPLEQAYGDLSSTPVHR